MGKNICFHLIWFYISIKSNVVLKIFKSLSHCTLYMVDLTMCSKTSFIKIIVLFWNKHLILNLLVGRYLLRARCQVQSWDRNIKDKVLTSQNIYFIERGGCGDNKQFISNYVYGGLEMASPTQWTWVWVDSGSWWWTGRPGVLWFMGSQRVGHDWTTELNWTKRGCSANGRTQLATVSVDNSLKWTRWTYWELE